MTDAESWPTGGVTPRKYAAMCLALGMARGALSAALQGDDMEGNRHVLEITSTAAVAKALRYAESDLGILWDKHLSQEEINRIKGWG